MAISPLLRTYVGRGLLAGGLLVGAGAVAQQPAAPELLPAPATVPLAGPLVLGFRVAGTGALGYAGFPDIEGFARAGC